MLVPFSLRPGCVRGPGTGTTSKGSITEQKLHRKKAPHLHFFTRAIFYVYKTLAGFIGIKHVILMYFDCY